MCVLVIVKAKTEENLGESDDRWKQNNFCFAWLVQKVWFEDSQTKTDSAKWSLTTKHMKDFLQKWSTLLMIFNNSFATPLITMLFAIVRACVGIILHAMFVQDFFSTQIVWFCISLHPVNGCWRATCCFLLWNRSFRQWNSQSNSTWSQTGNLF